jgi:RNA recognition motif-containing protein
MELTFPTFEDSGRSKGYCGILFQSPKAVAKAVELDGKELHGRWLRVQAGKMYLKQWEEQHEAGNEKRNKDEKQAQVGEFGQRVKRRKQHGFKDA